MNISTLYNSGRQGSVAGFSFVPPAFLSNSPSSVGSYPGATLAGTQAESTVKDFCFMPKGQPLPIPPIGTKFSKWEVISLPLPGNKAAKIPRRVECRCLCGRKGTVALADLYGGKSTGCVLCGYKSSTPRKLPVHGAAASSRKGATVEYNLWVGIQTRCGAEPSSRYYSDYPAKGVTVWPAWCGPGGFQRFLDDVGIRPSTEHKLIRYPVIGGNYEPSNVKWATTQELNRHKGDTKRFTLNGTTMCIAEWARARGMNKHVIHARLKTGMDFESALNTPVELRSSDPTRCVRGHLYTEDNAVVIAGKGRRWRRCRICRHFYGVAIKNTRILRATPPWLTDTQQDEINIIYLNRPRGYHVDHEVPLRGKNVCGLHVPWNLRAIPAIDNLRKGNRLILQAA